MFGVFPGAGVYRFLSTLTLICTRKSLRCSLKAGMSWFRLNRPVTNTFTWALNIRHLISRSVCEQHVQRAGKIIKTSVTALQESDMLLLHVLQSFLNSSKFSVSFKNNGTKYKTLFSASIKVTIQTLEVTSIITAAVFTLNQPYGIILICCSCYVKNISAI